MPMPMPAVNGQGRRRCPVNAVPLRSRLNVEFVLTHHKVRRHLNIVAAAFACLSLPVDLLHIVGDEVCVEADGEGPDLCWHGPG